MKRFKDRLDQLTADEALTITRNHRRYVKTIPGKLDHASLVAVNLAKMNNYRVNSAECRPGVDFAFKAVRTESSRSLGSLGKLNKSPMVSETMDHETRRGSIN